MFEENFGSLLPYKEYSINLERYNHPTWSKEELQKEVTNFVFKNKLHNFLLSLPINNNTFLFLCCE